MSVANCSLAEQVVMVTGAGGGIGHAASIAFAQAGAHLVLIDTDRHSLEGLAREIAGIGRHAIALAADVTDKHRVKEVVEVGAEHFGRIDVLFNNAGVGLRRPFLETEEEEWDRVINTNLKGAFLVAQAVARKMVERRSGVIINTASIAGFVGRNELAAYCASKGGLAQLTKVMAMELAPYGVRVNSISPGMIETPFTLPYLEADKARAKRISSKIPLGRLGKPDDLVDALLYLASRASAYVTGQTLVIDGGWTTGVETE